MIFFKGVETNSKKIKKNIEIEIKLKIKNIKKIYFFNVNFFATIFFAIFSLFFRY
jgi:hypothetical protein